MKRSCRPPKVFNCPSDNLSCPIKNGAVSPCTVSGCSYSKGGKGTDFKYAIIFGTVVTLLAVTIWYFSCKDGQCGFNPKPTPTISTNFKPSKLFSIEESLKIVNSLDSSLPDENKELLTMDGGVIMVSLMKKLRFEYEQVYPNKKTSYGLDIEGNPRTGEKVEPSGSDGGLRNLINGKILMAATLRPLNPNEIQKEIIAVPIARDAIVVMVGINNSFKGSLSKDQLRDIYLGKITNWSVVGGEDLPIKVYNLNKDSSARSIFKEAVLLGAEFPPDGLNFITWNRYLTADVLQALGNDGICYTNISHDEPQTKELARIVAIDGINPEDKQTLLNGAYPLGRTVYLATTKRTTLSAKRFIEFVLSPTGQNIVESEEFIRLPK